MGLRPIGAEPLDPSQFVTPNNMAFVPASAIPAAGASFSMTSGGKSITQDDVRRYWGKVAANIGVDAVAIVYFDLAYKQNFFSGVQILDVIASADVNVDVGIVAVTKDGVLALDSGGLTGERFAGSGAPLLRGGKTFTLADEKGEAIAAYSKALAAKAQKLADTLATELKAEK